jgi:hypothetical protein
LCRKKSTFKNTGTAGSDVFYVVHAKAIKQGPMGEVIQSEVRSGSLE